MREPIWVGGEQFERVLHTSFYWTIKKNFTGEDARPSLVNG